MINQKVGYIMAEQRKRLGDILVDAGRITHSQLEHALKVQSQSRKRLGEVLVDLGFVTEKDIINIVSAQLGIAKINLDEIFIDPEVARSIPREVAKKYNLIPVSEHNGVLMVAMSDPLNIYALDDIRFLTQKKVDKCITHASAIDRAIEIYFSRQTTDKAIEDLKREYGTTLSDGRIEAEIVTDDVQNAPAVRLSNSIIYQAVTIRASDIHIEPFERQILVRYRVDGVLAEGNKIPPNLYSAVSTRIKIMAGMNIAERRVPQDGRIEMDVAGRSYDFRVSSLPTVFGEKIVIRILDRGGSIMKRESLAFSELENTSIDRIVKMPYGIVLLTGPTGSGKTTTLYSFLGEVNTVDKNIVTVEDPVEYMLDGINQVQVNNKAGLTFATGLRSILRQDPDIIMVGEIRDEETAQIAVRAAITGHLVFSTLHTNDAPGAITRLIDMGVPPYLVADAIVAVIAQRLVRRLCNSCKEGYDADEGEQRILRITEPTRLYNAVGCPVCNGTGYKGRIAIHEVLMIDTHQRVLIETGANAEQIRVQAQKNGMMGLYDSCKDTVLRGVTTIQEMVKTVYARD